MLGKNALEVEEHSARAAEGAHVVWSHSGERAVPHGHDDRVVTGDGRLARLELETEFVAGLVPVDPRIPNFDLRLVLLETADEVDDLGIAHVRAVLLEGQAHDQNAAADNGKALLHHQPGDAVGDMASHAVVDASAGQDHLGVIADLLGAMSQVVRVDADTMAADETWF